MMPTLMRMERARRCFAGAIAAPAGLEAATPVVFTNVAAAVPRGSCVSLCGFGEGGCTLDDWSCDRIAPGLLGNASTMDVWACPSVAPLSEVLGRACADVATSACGLGVASCCGDGTAAARGAMNNSSRQPAICRLSQRPVVLIVVSGCGFSSCEGD